jgi:hypothetical protein
MRICELIIENTDDELFGAGTVGSGMKDIIYRTGKRLLSELADSWSLEDVRYEYNEYQEADDSDAMFSLVVRESGVKMRQAFAIDTILREFTNMEGLNDFGWMIEQGQFHELLDAWERFRADADIENETWFQREVQDFKGDR